MSSRLYMTRVGATPTTPTFAPAIHIHWERAAAFFTRWRALPTRPDLSVNVISQLFGATTTSETCYGQWISDPLATSHTFGGTVTVVVPVYETVTTENAVLDLAIRVVTPTGAERGLLVFGVSGAEFPAPPVATRVLGPVNMVPVAAQAGDRLVLEVGAQCTTPTNTGFLGFQMGGATGLPDFPPTAGLTGAQNGWWEFSDTLTFAGEPLVTATRFYFAQATPPPAGVAPTIATTWQRSVASFARYTALRRRSETGATTNYLALFGSTATSLTAWGQWITDRLDRDQTIAGTVSMVVSAVENGATEDASLAYSLRVLKPDGTFRGTLQALSNTTEFGTTLATQVHGPITLTPLACLRGDRLVFELGVQGTTPANVATIGLVYGAPGNLLVPDHVFIAGEPSASRVPWWELSQVVTFTSDTALGLYAPDTGAEVRLNVATFQEEPTTWRGQLRHSFNGTLLSSLRAPRRAWSATVEFGTETEVDAFVRFIDAAPAGTADPTSFRGSKLLHLFSDPLGLLRSTAVIPVRVEVGARTPSEKFEDGILRNVWAVALTIRE